MSNPQNFWKATCGTLGHESGTLGHQDEKPYVRPSFHQLSSSLLKVDR